MAAIQRQRLCRGGDAREGHLDDLRSLLDELLAETGGPLTDQERRNANAALGL